MPNDSHYDRGGDSPYGPRPAPPRREVTQDANNPYQAGSQYAQQPPGKPLPPGYIRLRPHRANTVLALGISGAVMAIVGGMMSYACCVFAFVPMISLALSIPAWVMGQQDLAAISAGEMDPAGRDSTTIGMIAGIVGVALIALGVLLIAGLMLFYFVFVGYAMSQS
jgi:hypothetical protein